jgi:hypothetical protein
MSEATAGLNGLPLAKLVLTLVGIGVFGAGIRFDSESVRWAGIAIVAIAFALRFVKAKPAPAQLPDDTR